MVLVVVLIISSDVYSKLCLYVTSVGLCVNETYFQIFPLILFELLLVNVPTKTHTHTHNLPTPGLTMGSAKRSRINGIRHRIYNDTDTASGKHKSLRMYQTGERRTVNPKAYMGKTYQWLH